MSWKHPLQSWGRRSPDRPRRKRAKIRLELLRLETRQLLSGPGIVEFAASAAQAQPVSAVAGSDGNLWVTEYAAKEVVAFSSAGAIVKTVAVSGMPYGVTAASDGTLWVTENGTTPMIGHLSPAGSGSVIAQYALPSGTNPQGIAAGPDGNIWFVGYGTSVVGQVTPAGAITTYSLAAGSRPVRITAGSDGNLWVTEAVGDRIARVTTSGAITEFAVPTKYALPWGIAAGPDGNLWFTEDGSGKIGRITTSGVISEFSLGGCCGMRPFDIVAGPDGNLWFTENTANMLGLISTTGTITQYPMLTTRSGPEGIAVGPGSASIWWTESSVGKVGELAWLTGGQPITTDPTQTQYNSFATGQIGPMNGDQRTMIPVDPAPYGGLCCCCGAGISTSAWTGSNLSLTYNSSTVAVQPIIDATYYTDPSGPVPTQIQATLTWNGTAQPPVTFQTTGHSPGDAYLLGIQVANPVASTGVYPWSVLIQATLPGGAILTSTVGGTAPVTANGPSDPYGQGWSVGGTAQLVSDGKGGFLWVDGNGGSRDFQAGGATSFTSPPNDHGTLVKNGNGTFTYTNPQQDMWSFNSQGQLTSIVQPAGPSQTFTYNGSGALTTVVDPGGWTATFTYDINGKLDAIVEPGGRTITVTHDGSGNLTSATDPNGGVMTFTYDSQGRLTNESWGTRSTTYSYDAQGALTGANEGLGSTLGLVPASIQGLQTNPAIDSSQGVSVVTDALGQVATISYDSFGEPTEIQSPNGAVQRYQYDFAGSLVVATDPMGRVTTYTYQYGAGEGELTQVTYPDESTIHYQYDPTFHQVTVEEDQLGRLTTFTYDSQGDLISTTDPLGGVTTEVWSNGLLQSTTDPLGRTTTYQYDSQRELVDQIDPLGGVTTYTYDSAGNQATVTDPLGRTTTSVYDGIRRIVEQTDALGGTTTTTYDAQGDVTSVTDPLGQTTQYLYDQRGNEIAQIDAVGSPVQRATTYTYDALGRQISVTDPNDHTTTSTYDSVGNLVSVTDALGGVTTYSYDLDNERVTTTDPLGRTTTYSYDSLGRRTGETDALGTPQQRSTTTEYDAVGNVIETIDPLGQSTTFTYDALNRQITVTDPLGLTTTVAYDAVGNVIATTDPLGHTTTHVYDALNRQVETIDPLNEVTTTVYDAVGNVVEIIDPRGDATHYSYDALDRQITVVDPLGRTTTTVYDAVGDVVETIDPLGDITTYKYDALDRQITITDPLGDTTTTVYDAVGNVIATTDPLGNTTSYTYDALNREVQTTDPLGAVTTYLYDAVGNQTGVIDPDGNRTTFLYDALNRKIETIDPLGNATTYSYDALDRKVSQTDPLGRVTTYAYDADSRLVGETWHAPGGAVSDVFTYTYDNIGNQLTATDSAGTYTMTYDALDRVVSVTDPLGLTLTYTYDADGNRILTQDSLGGVTTYIYDAANELTSEQFGGTGQTPLRIDMTYDARGELLSETRYSDLAGTQKVVTTNYSYNGDGQITNLTDVNGGGNTVASFTYTYDRADRLVTEDNLGLATTYTYDAADQLTSETSSLATIDYGYDPNGNRNNGNNVVGPNNQLTTDGVWNYTYDATGDLVKKVGVTGGPDNGITWTYAYNNDNQMTTAVEVQGSSTIASETYLYDALHNRIEEDYYNGSTTQVTRFAYDGQNVWADLNGSNALVMRRLYLNTVDSVTARITATGTVAWYLTDRLGSVRVITDATGAVIDRINDSGFGDILSETNQTASDRYLWTGREFDRVTDLQYNLARYYDPTTGRWTSQDPIGFAAGDANLYRYAGNDPTNATDPNGQKSVADQVKGLLDPAPWASGSMRINVVVPRFGGRVFNATLTISAVLKACCTSAGFVQDYYEGSATLKGSEVFGNAAQAKPKPAEKLPPPKPKMGMGFLPGWRPVLGECPKPGFFGSFYYYVNSRSKTAIHQDAQYFDATGDLSKEFDFKGYAHGVITEVGVGGTVEFIYDLKPTKIPCDRRVEPPAKPPAKKWVPLFPGQQNPNESPSERSNPRPFYIPDDEFAPRPLNYQPWMNPPSSLPGPSGSQGSSGWNPGNCCSCYSTSSFNPSSPPPAAQSYQPPFGSFPGSSGMG